MTMFLYFDRALVFLYLCTSLSDTFNAINHKNLFVFDERVFH